MRRLPREEQEKVRTKVLKAFEQGRVDMPDYAESCWPLTGKVDPMKAPFQHLSGECWANERAFGYTVRWGIKGFGFGEVNLYYSLEHIKGGVQGVHLDDEEMGADFVRRCFKELAGGPILEGEGVKG